MGELVVRLRLRAVGVAVTVALGTAAPAAVAGPAPHVKARPSVVVAVADTGVNPYHQVFYRPKNTAHPCTWVKGFTDCSIPALPLSVGTHDSVEEAFDADRALWASVEQHRWYWIPKTNIIGAVCDEVVGGGAAGSALARSGPTACILDENGHGTGTASAVLSEAPDALLLVHEGNMGANDMVSAPVAPDIQSHSWGYPTPMPLQLARPVKEDACDVGRAPPSTLVFLAAGNESPMPSLADCWRSDPDIQVVGGGYPGYVQGNSWTVYDFASWFCRPTASQESVAESVEHCGTSFSAPTAAGAAAAALLRVRQHDRYSARSTRDRVSRTVSRVQFVDALRAGATYSPKVRFPDSVPCPDPTAACFDKWKVGAVPLPAQAPHLFWGYGWLDSTVTDTVVSCALRRACPSKAADARTYNEQRQQARAVTSLESAAPAANDAGSGRDAGEDVETAVPVVPGRSYSGRLATSLDWGDSYTVRARAGQRLTVTSTATPAAGSAACWVVWGPGGERLTPSSQGNVSSCASPGFTPTDLRLPAAGTYRVQYWGYLPHDYAFSLSLAG